MSSRAVKLSEEVVQSAEINAKAYHRSTAKQIEHWVRIGKIAEENPELSYLFIEQMLIGIEELKAGKTEPYIFD